jgi:hypothetical protein
LKTKRLGASIGEVISAAEFVNTATVEGLTIWDIVTSTILSHPSITAACGSSSPECLVLWIVTP